MEGTGNTDNPPQPQQAPEINPEKAAVRIDFDPPIQPTPDDNDDELFEVKPVNEEEDGKSAIIPVMEAICEICYVLIPKGATVLKRKCDCIYTKLIHEDCSENDENTKCDLCDQTIQYVKASLTSRPKVQPEELKSTSKKKRNIFKSSGRR